MEKLNMSPSDIWYRIRSRWWSRRAWSLPLPTNTSKQHLHVKQLPQKSKGRLVELLYKYSFKNNFHINGRVEKTHKIDTFVSGRDLLKKKLKKIHIAEFSHLGNKVVELHNGCPSPRVL